MNQQEAEAKLLAALGHKKASSLNPEERKLLLIKQLEKSKRSTMGDAAMGKITNWQDFLNLSGITVPAELSSQEITMPAIKKAFDIYIEQVKSGNLVLEIPTPTSKPVEVDDSGIPDTDPRYIDEFTAIDCLRNNPQVIYNKHQEKAAAALVRGLMKHKRRGQALNCRVGGGKTFILGAVIRELWERQWDPIMKSVSMYPLVYVTKATIVEQTERVLYKKFGLRPGHQVDVTNIEQFRSKFGERFLKEHIHIDGGREYTYWKWAPLMAPALMIVDESQGVKNIDSTQSKQFQAYNDLEGDYYTIHSSATLFTRVIESKVLAVATRLQW